MSTSNKRPWVPFTYFIGWTSADTWYYGVRFGKGAHPNELWKTYFTSSKKVLSFRKEHGEPDVIQVRRTFSDAKSATDFETKVLKRMKVITRANFLNDSYCTASGSLRTRMCDDTKAKIGKASKGRKTFLGRHHSEETKRKMKNKVVTEETRLKMSKSAIGRKASDQTRLNMSIARTGTTQTEETKAKMSATWARKKAEGYKAPQVTEETRAKHRAREARLRQVIPT